MCAGAFAQGKINIMNDTGHLVYSCWDNSLITGPNYLVDLYGYAGTGSGSLALLTSVPMNPSIPGIFGPFNWNSPLPGGSPSTFQVRVRDLNVGWVGASQIFTMQPGGSIAYNSLFNPGGTTLSTWAIGTVPVAGGFGAIMVPSLYPEPSRLALSGLGLASLLLFHRRR